MSGVSGDSADILTEGGRGTPPSVDCLQMSGVTWDFMDELVVESRVDELVVESWLDELVVESRVDELVVESWWMS